ncbi:hypothetical protein [Ectothiorhodospira shaposhnikovii]|uniref:hypothetical protein n=1 Tax=Ectothiorhodospira shaposhnikovii TaxID=1054 RepID=UPI001EE974AD|nr:hypothetical protein [Ectothiorhodospira shaposhnikovii]MCG5512312.1 hypothetical protein [Ectothiorhodospira shaposhnikovii]
MQTQIPFRKTLLATLVAAGIGLTGCNSDTGNTQAQSNANLPGSAVVAVSARLPGSGDAQASYIDPATQLIEVRAFPFPYGSWDELAERLGDFDRGYHGDQEGLWIDWENPVNSTTLTADNPRGEIALTPGTYLIVAGSWSDGDTSGDPLSGSATLVNLDKGEHQVALNMLRATWDIDGTLNLQELNNARGFDWAPGRAGTQSPAAMLGLGNRLTGVHILFKGGDEHHYDWEDSFFGLGFLPGLSQGVVWGTNTDQGWVTPGWGWDEAWDEDDEFNDEESVGIDWYVGSTGALLQDYAPESGNRAFVVLPEMYIEAYRDNWQEDEWQWREAGLFALSLPMLEMLDGDNEYSSTYQTQVCDPDGLNCELRWVAWQSVDQDLSDLPFDPATLPAGAITNGDTIEVTLVEWQDLDWVTDGTWVERDAPPTLDRDAPSPARATAAAQRQAHQADKQTRLGQALQRARFAQQQTPGSAVTTNCYTIAFEDLYWNAQFIWDEERGQWIPGTLEWTSFGQAFFHENQFRDPETGELQDTFFAETSSGETRACVHEVTLKARQLDAGFQESFPGFFGDGSDTTPILR